MIFSSLTFLCIFLPALIVLYFAVKPTGARNCLLCAASLLFYAFGEPVYIFLMIVSIIINYLFGRAVKGRKAVLAAAVILNLLSLGVFKYAGWIAGMIAGAFGFEMSGFSLSLPIGISFYTFQALSYVIDVYRGECETQKNIICFFLYISFFPQLIAGPIVKYHDIEGQLCERRTDAKGAAEGLRRFIFGLSKKVLAANILAKAADTVFAMNADSVCTLSAWIGAVSYLLQIYFDFSGYSDMAIGLGKIFGFRIPENFRYPYGADCIKDFWHRWHISLSTWFKEYLYIPLGGNRKGRLRTCVNKIIVFFCTGLWHGANMTFVVWGLFHGAFLLLEDFVPVRKLPKAIRHVYTVLVVCVGFVIFRADNMTQAWMMISKMFAFSPAGHTQFILSVSLLTPLFITVLIAGILGCVPLWRILTKRIADSPSCQSASYIFSIFLLALCMLYLSGGGYNPFIYFRF